MADLLSVNVDVPQELRERLAQRMRELQFRDAAFYVRWLVAKDIAPESEDAVLLTNLLLEGEASGPPIEADAAFFRDLKTRLDGIIAEKAAANVERAAG